MYWVRGNKSLARIHLAFANLPRLESCEDAFRLYDEWATQARNQIAAARAAGNRQVEWWFYEQSSANYAREVFKDADLLDQIIIRHLDYPGDARWPYPASAQWAKG